MHKENIPHSGQNKTLAARSLVCQTEPKTWSLFQYSEKEEAAKAGWLNIILEGFILAALYAQCLIGQLSFSFIV